jgi:ABC-type microcin C transport system permease subunit YejE
MLFTFFLNLMVFGIIKHTHQNCMYGHALPNLMSDMVRYIPLQLSNSFTFSTTLPGEMLLLLLQLCHF